jgi:2-haloalkanoic acid dehalogenase type II
VIAPLATKPSAIAAYPIVTIVAMVDYARYEALSFDCYGTLIDWESGILAVLRPWAERYSATIPDEELLAAHGRHETTVQQEAPGTLYPEVLRETMRRIGRDLGFPVTAGQAAAYGDSVREWPAFPDSAPALRRLAGAYSLIILSNVDRESFAASNALLEVDFDLVVTAEDVGAYKPDRRGFDLLFTLLPQVGTERRHLLHVAESLYHDHGPAAALGLDSVWIDRRHGKAGFGATAVPETPVTPLATFPSLGDFAARVLDAR